MINTVSMKAFSDEMQKISSWQSALGGAALGAGVGGVGGAVASPENRLKGALVGSGVGAAGGAGVGALSSLAVRAARNRTVMKEIEAADPSYVKNIDDALKGKSGKEKRKIRLAVEQEATQLNPHLDIDDPLNLKAMALRKRLDRIIAAGGTATGLGAAGAGAGGAALAHRMDKTSASMKPEDHEELKQFLKNTGAIMVGTGAGLGAAGLTRVALEKAFGPKGEWPNKLGPGKIRVISTAAPVVLGGGALYGYSRLRKRDKELREQARSRARK